jgi:hypothetical protein
MMRVASCELQQQQKHSSELLPHASLLNTILDHFVQILLVDIMDQHWVRAVRLDQAGTVLHIVLQHTLSRTAAQAEPAAVSNVSQGAT